MHRTVHVSSLSIAVACDVWHHGTHTAQVDDDGQLCDGGSDDDAADVDEDGETGDVAGDEDGDCDDDKDGRGDDVVSGGGGGGA
eukprot:6261290-Pyramimonas_sp.AAC.1